MNDFIKYNNMEIINDGDIFVKVEIKDECLNPFHIVHGGLIFALGDTAMGVKIKSLGKKVGMSINNKEVYHIGKMQQDT